MNRTLIRTCALAAGIAILLPASASADEKYIGEVFSTAGGYCPAGSYEARGQMLAIVDNATLYSVIGTRYGGDGRTTFQLPQLSGRVIVGSGYDYNDGQTRPAGEAFGVPFIKLDETTLPPYEYSIVATVQVPDPGTNDTLAADLVPPLDTVTQADASGEDVTFEAAAPAGPPAMVSATRTTTIKGGGEYIQTRDPSLTMTYCIVVNGTYPVRP